MMRTGFATAALLLVSVAAFGQEGQLHADFRREFTTIGDSCGKFQLKPFGECLKTIVTDHPLHLAAGNIAPQNGLGTGLAFVYQKNVGERWRLDYNADTVVSTNQSWRAGLYFKAILAPTTPVGVIIDKAGATRRPAHLITSIRERPEFNLYAQAISLNQINYFGLGNFTSKSSLALYGMQENIAGGNATLPLKFGFSIYGEIHGRTVDLRGRHGEGSPSIEQSYSELSAPGLTHQPAFLQLGERVRFKQNIVNRVKLDYSAMLQHFVASNDSRFSFRRMTLDFAHDIPLHKTSRSVSQTHTGPNESPEALTNPRFTRNLEGSLGLRVLIQESIAPAGHVVPFYFQPTLGGTDINGDRGLSSYPDYRFRAPNLLLMRATFEHSLWGPLGFAAASDVGKVALTRNDISLEHLRHSFAVGATIRAGGFPQVWLLFAWGGGEGTHTIAYINPLLLGGAARPSLY